MRCQTAVSPQSDRVSKQGMAQKLKTNSSEEDEEVAIAYEREREERINRNKAKLQELQVPRAI